MSYNYSPPAIHQQALANGFTETIPVVPPLAPLHEFSRVDPAARGKVPGDFYRGAWDGFAGWPEYVMTPETAVYWDGLGANVGLKCGVYQVALDIDVTDPTLAAAIMAFMESQSLGLWPYRVGEAPKVVWLFNVSGDPIRSRQYPVNKDGEERQLIEVKGCSPTGRPSQVVIAGGHPCGQDYEWNIQPTSTNIPTITQELMDEYVEYLLTIAEDHEWIRGRPSSEGSSDGTGSDLGAEAFDPSTVPEIISLVGNDNLEYEDWIRIGYAIKAVLGEDGLPYFDQWSARSATKYDPKFTKTTWKGLKARGDVGFGSLVHWAKVGCGGILPGDLAQRIKMGALMKGAENVGMPMNREIPPLPPVSSAVLPDMSHVATPANTPDWIPLVFNDNGSALPISFNLVAIFQNTPKWNQCFMFDAFNNRKMLSSPLPGSNAPKSTFKGRNLEDKDYSTIWYEITKEQFHKMGRNDVIHAVDHVCHLSTNEPVQDYLNAKTWDGIPRLDTWLVTYAGARSSDDPEYNEYLATIGRKWLISAVARAMLPGCQADHALIFEGYQGLGKSTTLRTLCPDPEWFGDALPDFHNKDSSAYLDGKWIVEMAELTGIYRSEIEQMRNFLTRKVEDYRPPYAKNNVKRPRRCVFAGSTNRSDYLKDSAGERRFWIVPCSNPADAEGLAAHRDQIWAEAKAAFDAGEAWYMAPGSAVSNYATLQQQERVPVDSMMDDIRFITEHHTEISVKDVANAMPGIGWDRRATNSETMQIVGCLNTLGFEKKGTFTTAPRKGRAKYIRTVTP